MSTPGPENRKQTRYKANFFLYFVGGYGERFAGNAYTRNISEGGCFVETGEPGHPGMEFDVEVFLDVGVSVLPMRATAKLMWSNRDPSQSKLGMGLAFTPMDETAMHYLQLALTYLMSPKQPLPGRALDRRAPKQH